MRAPFVNAIYGVLNYDAHLIGPALSPDHMLLSRWSPAHCVSHTAIPYEVQEGSQL